MLASRLRSAVSFHLKALPASNVQINRGVRNDGAEPRRANNKLWYEHEVENPDFEPPRPCEEVHPFQNLYPWNTIEDFVDHLHARILVNDRYIVAFDKPWGVGIHKQQPYVTQKTNYHLFSEGFGDPKFCLDDAIDLLADRIGHRNKLLWAKAIDRYQSGPVILAKTESGQRLVQKAHVRLQTAGKTHMTYLCLTKGYPTNAKPTLEERVGVKMVELDELGDYKEPQIVGKYSQNSIKRLEIKPALVKLRVCELNKYLSTGLLEIKTTFTKWNFIQCYAAHKTSFILGDVRFGRRVRQVLGVPLLLSPHNLNAYDDFDPLPLRIKSRLLVDANKNIPLMIHVNSITLPRYPENNHKDFEITTKELPPHFLWSMQQLGLLRKKKKLPAIDRQ